MKIVFSLLIGAALAASSVTSAQGRAGNVTVTVTGVMPDGGPVLVALQDESGFAQVAGKYSATVTPTGRTVRATIRNVTAGRYAAAVVQDTNKDGTLTLGATGPSEPFGFSGPSQRGAPAFRPASFQVNAKGGSARVMLTAR